MLLWQMYSNEISSFMFAFIFDYVLVTVHIIEIFFQQDSELLQERQLKEDLLQQTEAVSKFQETESKF
jgi:sensor histidine kinase regulating citrate/malate metabolism